MTQEFAGSYELQLQTPSQKYTTSCRVQPVPPGTPTRQENSACPQPQHYTTSTAYQTPSNVVASKNTGLYSQQNIQNQYSQFASQNYLPQPAQPKKSSTISRLCLRCFGC